MLPSSEGLNGETLGGLRASQSRREKGATIISVAAYPSSALNLFDWKGKKIKMFDTSQLGAVLSRGSVRRETSIYGAGEKMHFVCREPAEQRLQNARLIKFKYSCNSKPCLVLLKVSLQRETSTPGAEEKMQCIDSEAAE